MMTIDERIEALTHSVELLARMHLDNESRYAEMFQRIDRSLQHHETILQQLSANLERLTDIVNDHDKRLDDLEGTQS